MTCRNRIVLTLTFSLFYLSSTLTDMNFVNLLIPYDTLIRPSFTNKYRWQLAGYAETGYHNAHGFNDDGDHVNVLRIWNSQQNALSMLEGFAFDTDIGQLVSICLFIKCN